MEQFFLALVGFSGGFIVAGGVVALMVGLGIITRFIGISRTAKYIRGVEDAILLGAAVGTIVTVFSFQLPVGAWVLAVAGLFMGIFVGGWIMALAEVVNVFPVSRKGDELDCDHAADSCCIFICVGGKWTI